MRDMDWKTRRGRGSEMEPLVQLVSMTAGNKITPNATAVREAKSVPMPGMKRLGIRSAGVKQYRREKNVLQNGHQISVAKLKSRRRRGSSSRQSGPVSSTTLA